MVEDAGYRAWKAGLEEGDFAVADRVEDMPVEFAIAYLAVEIHRANHQIEEIRRPLWRRAATSIGLIAGGAVAAFFGNGGQLKP